MGYLERALQYDPENLAAHYNLYLAYRQLGEDDKAAEHFAKYQTFKPDDNARDRAVAIARAADPAADHAAEAIVIYDLRRPDAFGLGATLPSPQTAARPAAEEATGVPAS